MRAVLYDFDGLLIDSETAGLLSWQEVYTEFGHELDMAHWLAETLAGRGPCMPTSQLDDLVGGGIDWSAIEPRRQRRRDELISARPGVVAHLAEAASLGMATAVVSNAPDWWIAQQLDNCGLPADAFDVIVSKSETLAKKPAPDAYLAALRSLRVEASEAVAFEDSPIGIDAAHKAGVACVAVPNMVTAQFDLSRADLLLPALDSRSLADVTRELASRRGIMG